VDHVHQHEGRESRRRHDLRRAARSRPIRVLEVSVLPPSDLVRQVETDHRAAQCDLTDRITQPGHVAIGSINSPMQCMMKGVCAQCLCKHVDPDTGEIEMRPGDDGRWVEVREKGLKFYHPLGSLRAFRRTLRENRQKLIMVPTVDDRWIWRVTEKKDAEAQPKPSDSLPEDNRVLAITRPMPTARATGCGGSAPSASSPPPARWNGPCPLPETTCRA